MARFGAHRAILWFVPAAALMMLGFRWLRSQSAALPTTGSGATVSETGTAPARTPARHVGDSYGALPLAFEVNSGQTDHAVKFVSRGRGYSLFLTSTEAVLALRRGVGHGKQDVKHPAAVPVALLRTRLVGANAAPHIAGQQMLAGKSNYFIGNDPHQWHTNVAQYAKVKYDQVYPGIDLLYYGNQRQLEYDFVVAPGANPQAIKFGIDGAKQATVNRHGDLVLDTGSGQVIQHLPVAYQTINGKRQPVASRYRLKTQNSKLTK